MRASRVMAAGAVAAIAVGSVTLSTTAQAKAATTATTGASRTRPTVTPVAHRAHMGSYGASKFAKAAAKLPSGLDAQLRKQLGITPEQFLADGQAGADAGKVIASLRSGGVTVLGAELDGTTLTVTTRDAAGVAAAEADGARAVIGTAPPVKTVKAKALSSPADGSSALLGGDLWFYFTNKKSGQGLVCSTGFNGYAASTGAREFLTAGHCGDYHDTGEPAPADGVVYGATDKDPVTLDQGVPIQEQLPLGSLGQSSFHFGGGADSGVVNVTDAQARPEPAVNTWNSRYTSAGANESASLGVENSGGTVPVLGAAAAFSGEPVCHSGERTGWQCGTVEKDGDYVTADVTVGTINQQVDGFETSVCDLPGDSGGSFVSGEYALGVASAGSFTPESGSGAGDNTCSRSGATIAYPMVPAADGEGSENSVARSEPGFELAVSLPAPVVTTATADVVTGDGTISGDLPAPFATGTPVSLSLDGHTTASTTTDSSGDWSFSLSGLADGTHSYTVTAASGHSTASTTKTFSLGQVSASGAPQVGNTLTAGVTGAPSDGTVAYQWNENGKTVYSGQTYLVAASDVGQTLTVTATVTEGGNSVSVMSGPIAVAKLTAVKPPAISGTVKVGSRVAASPGTWSVTGPAFTYQWLGNGKPISGATSASYTIPASLAGGKLSVTVTAHKSGYSNAAGASAASTVAKGTFTVPVRPKLSGTPAVGKTLTVTRGTWSPAAATAIQWYANGRPVAHATGTGLRLTAALRGAAVSVTVTGSKAGYVTAAVRLTESIKVRA